MAVYREQKKLLEELKKYERKFDRKDYDSYQMMIKREKDEEEFDTVTMKRLKEMYDKYYTPPDRSKLDALFKKNE